MVCLINTEKWVEGIYQQQTSQRLWSVLFNSPSEDYFGTSVKFGFDWISEKFVFAEAKLHQFSAPQIAFISSPFSHACFVLGQSGRETRSLPYTVYIEHIYWPIHSRRKYSHVPFYLWKVNPLLFTDFSQIHCLQNITKLNPRVN